MVAAHASDPKYLIEFTGNARDAAAKLKTLANSGPLAVSKDHKLAAMLPDALDRDSLAPKVAVRITDLHAMLIPGLIFESEAAKQGMHLAIDPGRLGTVIKDLDAAGFDWTPIHGALGDAVTEATARFTAALQELPDEARTITTEHMLYDDDPNNAGTATWYDWVSPSMLMAGGGGSAAVAEFMALIPDAIYSGTPGGRDPDGPFGAAIEQMAASVGRDISGMGDSAQAAAVAAWFKRTRPPHGLQHYIEDSTMEVERRAAATPAERFEPLYVVGWRKAYPLLNALWPHAVHDIVTDTGALAVAMGVHATGGLTPQILTALTDELREYLPFALSDSNAKRTAEVKQALRHADAGGDRKEDLSADAKAQLQADDAFQQFKRDVEACGIDQHLLMATTMMRAEHAAGLLFLNGKLNHDKFWKERAAARTPSNIQSVFNTKVSVTTANEAAEWGSVLPANTSKQLVAGKFTLIRIHSIQIV
jgi:hypothetical protein